MGRERRVKRDEKGGGKGKGKDNGWFGGKEKCRKMNKWKESVDERERKKYRQTNRQT